MKFRNDDIGREFTRKELDRQDFVDNSIMKLINKVNPTEVKIRYDEHYISNIRYALIEVFTDKLKLCNEYSVYP